LVVHTCAEDFGGIFCAHHARKTVFPVNKKVKILVLTTRGTLCCTNLATTAPCDMRPPSSVTTAPTKGKKGVHPMSVDLVINTSPFDINYENKNGNRTFLFTYRINDYTFGLDLLNRGGILEAMHDACAAHVDAATSGRALHARRRDKGRSRRR
jgi:hypothetical protein